MLMIKPKERVEVENITEFAYQKDELANFKFLIIDVQSLISLIDNNIEYKDVKQSGDDNNKDEEEYKAILSTSRDPSEQINKNM